MAGRIDSYNITLGVNTPVSVEEIGVEHRAVDIAITPLGGLADVFMGSPDRQLTPVGSGLALSDIVVNGVDSVWDLGKIYIVSASGGDVNILVTLLD